MKKLLALLLSVAMILSVCLTPALAAEPETAVQKPVQFADMADSHWAKESIDRWSSYGIVNGDEKGHVNADQPLRRCEMAQVLVNLLGLTQEAENTFGDLTGKEWYAGTILKCAAAGIMKGDGVNCNAEDPVSRQEAIVMFGRAMGVRPVADPDLTKFNDHADVADWAAPYMAPLTEMGILSGVNDGSTVAPKADMDRASAFALLDKAITVYANEPGEYEAADPDGFVVVNSAAEETGEVVVSGEAAGVVVSKGTTDTVVVKDMTADTVKVDAPVDLTVEGKDTVLGSVQLNDAATVDVAKGVQVDTLEANAPATVTNNGTVDSLVANDAVKVDNQGTVKDATVNADGVVVDGKAPQKMEVAEGVAAPTDSEGDEVKPSRPGGSTVTRPSTPPVTKYTVTVDQDIVGGEVTATPTSAAAGTTIKVTATAKDGYELGDVTYTVGSDTAVIEMTDGKGSFTMPKGNVTVSATFTEVVVPPTPADDVYSITVDVDTTTGTVTTSPENEAKAGVTVSVTATAKDGYELDTLTYTADGKTEDIKETKSFTMPAADVTVKASFKAVTPAVVAVTSVTLDKTSADVYITDNDTNPTMKLVATVKPDNATDKTVTWDSSDKTVATVNDAGLVTALKAGETTITATAGGKTAACDIKVIDKRTPAPEVDKTALEAAITAAEAAKTGIKVEADSVTEADVEEGVKFYSQSDVDDLTDAITQAQKVVDAPDASQDTVDAAVTELNSAVNTFNSKVKTGTKTEGPVDVPVESVTLNETAATIYTVGNDTDHPHTIQLTATVNPSNATNKTVTWSTSDNTVATVDESTGLVTAVAEGTAKITATADGKSAECTITVVDDSAPVVPVNKDALNTAITAANTAKEGVTVGTTADQVANGTHYVTQEQLDALETAITAAQTVADNAEATQEEVDNAKTALETATTTFNTAKDSQVGTKVDTVAVESVTLDKNEATIDLAGAASKTLTLVATVLPDNATDKTVTWSSSNTAVATVEDGTVTALKAGVVTITVTSNADNTKTAHCDITVKDSTKPVVTTVEQLTAALADTNVTEITVAAGFDNGTTNTDSDYVQYTVTSSVTIKGETGATVLGSFVVKSTADGTVFDGLTIKNLGWVNGTSAMRNCISANVKTLTVTGCTLECGKVGGQLANGLMILPSAVDVTYTITGNTFKGFKNTTVTGEGTPDKITWASTGLMITGGVTRTYLSDTAGMFASITDEQDLAFINGNTFQDCKTDYVRDNYTGDTQKIIARCNSTVGTSLNFGKAAETATYYIKGAVTRESDTTLKAGTTLKLLDKGSLTIQAGSRLFVENGAIISDADKAKIEGDVVYGGDNNAYDVQSWLAGQMKKFESKYYNLSGTQKTHIYDTAWDDEKRTPEDGYVTAESKNFDKAEYMFYVGEMDAVNSLKLNDETDALSLDKEVRISIGYDNFLHTVPYVVENGKVFVNSVLLAANAKAGDGTVKVSMEGTNTNSDGTTEPATLTVTYKLFNYPAENNLYVTQVAAPDTAGGVEFTETTNHFTGSNTAGYTIEGTFTDGQHERVLIGVNLATDANGTTVLDGTQEDKGPVIVYEENTQRYALGFTELGENLYGTIYSYGTYPVYSKAEGGTRTITVLIPGAGSVKMTFTFTPETTETPVTPAP